jgi:hypothetical protein
LFGAPAPEKFSATADGKALAAAAELHFTARTDVSRLLAIEKLVLDVFNDGQAARAFAVNPDEYLRRSGFAGVRLDLNSQEVKIVMAMGDPAARQAAMRGDVEGFVDAVMAQGIKPGAGIGRFVHVEALVHSSVVAYFIAAVVTYQKITTATAVPIVVAGVPDATAAHMKVLTRIAEHIGDRAFTRQLASRKAAALVAKYTDLAQRKFDHRR